MSRAQINPRTSLLWCVKAACILACWAASMYCTFFVRQSFAVGAAATPFPYHQHPCLHRNIGCDPLGCTGGIRLRAAVLSAAPHVCS